MGESPGNRLYFWFKREFRCNACKAAMVSLPPSSWHCGGQAG